MATSWSPVFDQTNSLLPNRIVSAQVNGPMLSNWFSQTLLPVAQTPLSTWLMNDAKYVPPIPQGRLYPSNDTRD